MPSRRRVMWTTGFAALACLSILPTSYAESLNQAQQQMNALQSQKSQLAGAISQDESQAQKLQGQVQSAADAVAVVNQQLSSVQQRETQLNAQLAAIHTQIAQTSKALDTDQRQLAERLRVMYENGNVDYLSVLLDSTSFSDFLTRWQFLALLSEQDHVLADKARAAKASLLTQKSSFESTAATLQQQQAQLALLKATDVALQQHQQGSLDAIQNRLSSEQNRSRVLESNIHLTEQQIANIEAETQAAQQRMANPTYVQHATQSLASVNSNELIQFAMKYLGTPYAWGGTTPAGFDCSGFTQYVFSHAGISLGRTAADQFSAGVPVGEGDLHPDDLVFFSTYAPGATHVGIYIGNGMMVDAQDNGVCVDSIHSSYWASRYIGARRYSKT